MYGYNEINTGRVVVFLRIVHRQTDRQTEKKRERHRERDRERVTERQRYTFSGKRKQRGEVRQI